MMAMNSNAALRRYFQEQEEIAQIQNKMVYENTINGNRARLNALIGMAYNLFTIGIEWLEDAEELEKECEFHHSILMRTPRLKKTAQEFIDSYLSKIKRETKEEQADNLACWEHLREHMLHTLDKWLKAQVYASTVSDINNLCGEAVLETKELGYNIDIYKMREGEQYLYHCYDVIDDPEGILSKGFSSIEQAKVSAMNRLVTRKQKLLEDKQAKEEEKQKRIEREKWINEHTTKN